MKPKMAIQKNTYINLYEDFPFALAKKKIAQLLKLECGRTALDNGLK